MSHLNFSILVLSTNFCPIKTDMSGTIVWPQDSGVQKLVKINFLGIFNQLLSIQNANVTRFARNIEWDFFVIFKHRVAIFELLWTLSRTYLKKIKRYWINVVTFYGYRGIIDLVMG